MKSSMFPKSLMQSRIIFNVFLGSKWLSILENPRAKNDSNVFLGSKWLFILGSPRVKLG